MFHCIHNGNFRLAVQIVIIYNTKFCKAFLSELVTIDHLADNLIVLNLGQSIINNAKITEM